MVNQGVGAISDGVPPSVVLGKYVAGIESDCQCGQGIFLMGDHWACEQGRGVETESRTMSRTL
jgi:hypothetical protein